MREMQGVRPTRTRREGKNMFLRRSKKLLPVRQCQIVPVMINEIRNIVMQSRAP